jgi:uncharacterized membrane protein YdjX (TVP38/TMEM64 family)
MIKLSRKAYILISVVLFLIALASMYFSGVLSFFSLANLKSHREMLVSFVANHYFWSVLIYLIVTIVVIATTLPLAAFVMILAGLLFGVKWGVIYANIGATIGACISFGWLRYLFGETVPDHLKARLATFSKNIEAYGSLYFLSMHLMSLLPFFLINALAVVAHISFFNFLWTTSLGIIPISILYAYVGQRLCEINAIGEVLTKPIIGAFIALALIALMPVIVSKFKQVK